MPYFMGACIHISLIANYIAQRIKYPFLRYFAENIKYEHKFCAKIARQSWASHPKTSHSLEQAVSLATKYGEPG